MPLENVQNGIALCMKTRFPATLWFLTLGILLPVSGSAAAAPEKPDWEVVRSLHQKSGGTTYYVLVPGRRQRDRGYYGRVADQVCGSADRAFVFFWTDRAHVPESEWMPVGDMRVMTATYERSPNYHAPHLHLAAWLYPSKEAARQADAFNPP